MPTPILSALDLQPDQRAVILHADDLGMFHAANAAFDDIVRAGITKCGSVMVPTPWFRELVDWAKSNPHADIGVHITLTSEWDAVRWRPISTTDRASGLMDGQGYFWRDVPSLFAHMNANAAIAEMRAQIEAALDAGLDVTHLDTHMGSVAHPALLDAYVNLAFEFRLPAMVNRIGKGELEFTNLPTATQDSLAAKVADVEARGMPIMEWEGGAQLDAHEGKLDEYAQLIAGLPSGLSHLYYHAVRDSEELRAAAPDWRARVADRDAMTDPALSEILARENVRVIGYRELRDAMRS